MSDEPVQQQPAPQEPGDHGGDSITEERQRELKALAEQQREWAAKPEAERGDSHFKGMRLTGADAFWLAAYAFAGPEGDVAAAQAKLRAARDDEEMRSSMSLSALHLEGAVLYGAHLERATLGGAHLEGAVLGGAHLERAVLYETHLEGAVLIETHLERAVLVEAHLERATLGGAHLERAVLGGAHLERAVLGEAHLEGADLHEARLERAVLYEAHLERAVLVEAHLEGTDLRGARLEGADLRLAHLNAATALNDLRPGDAQGGTVRVADARWGGVNLAVVDWTPFTDGKAVLGDEQAARDWMAKPFTETKEQRKRPRRERARARAKHATKQDQERLAVFQAGVRANRQVATALREQGMNEEADYFAYRAQVLQRRVFQLQRKRGRAGFSRFLDLLAGYGYAPQRSLFWYVLTVLSFAALYVALAHLPAQEALILSVTSFHGRGFPGTLTLHDPIMMVAAAEAIFGLLIEISFIATFTQRYFGK